MQGKNKLFGASFEQSKRIVKDDILTEEGTQIGSFSSMSFWSRASLLLVLFANIITYGVGIHLPDSLRATPESIQVVSESTVAQIGEVGFYLRPIIIWNYPYDFIYLFSGSSHITFNSGVNNRRIWNRCFCCSINLQWLFS